MTTPTQGEHAQPSLSYEQQRAIMEGERNASLAAFNHDDRLSRDGEAIYEAGFISGWNRHAAKSAQPAAPQGGAYVENPAEIEHVAGDVSKNRAESNMTGGAYAELPARRRSFFCTKCGGRECEPNTLGQAHPVCKCGYMGFAEDLDYTADQMRDFADRTHALRASHGQAPAVATLDVFGLQWPGEDRINLSTVFDTEAEALEYRDNRCDTPGILVVRLSAQPSPTAQPAPAAGNWIAADDVNRLVRELDVCLNGEAGAAAQASLCDVVAQVRHETAKRGQPLLAAPAATPQADNQPEDENDAHNFDICQCFDHWLLEKGAMLTPHSEESDGPMAPALNWIASVEAMVAARAPADSVTAPATGAVAGPVEKQVQRIGKELLRSEQMHAAKPDRIASALRAMSESMHTDYKQEIGSNNCMQCCVAYMLGMPFSQVPHFAQSNDPVACWDGFQSFIAKQGYTAVMLPGDQRPESHYLASGKSARGTSHMVVMHDGKLLHDPHPTKAGLVDVQCIWLLAKSAAAPTPAAQGDAEDAARWQELRAQHEDDAAERCCVFAPNDMRECLVPVGSLPGELDAFMDCERQKRAALAQKEAPHGN